MAGKSIIWPRSAATVAAIAVLWFAGLAPGRAAGLDPALMSADAIKALEQRLTDAGCYQGAIDGKASAALDDAIKACPDQRPYLRIETGMHGAIIRRIGVDAACSLIATASDDKTVRLWSLPDGKLKRTIRLPIGDGDAGKVDATALSPDGRLLAIGRQGGYFSGDPPTALYLYEIETGRELRLLRRTPFGSRILELAFDGNGGRLAIGFKGPEGGGVVPGAQGIRVVDAKSGQELLADADYGDDVYGLAFAPDGALITSSYDGQLRRYEPDLKLTAKRAAPDGKDPNGVAIDPTGKRVAVGYYEEPPISILDATTLKPLAKAQTSDVANGQLSSVAWSRDGATLVAGGKSQAQFKGEWRRFLRRFDLNGRRRGADIAVSDSTVMDIQPCGAGFAFAAQDPSFGLLSAEGAATTLQGPRTPDMRDKTGSTFAIARDASSVRFGLGYGDEKPVVFDLAAASLSDSPSLPSGFALARVDGLPVADWKDNTAPKFNGAKIVLKNYEMSRALAVRPDASGFVLGTEWRVRAYDAKGKQRWERPGPGIAWGVDFSADGQIIVVAYGDGTIRWLRWDNGEELLAFFVEPQSRKWVAWTPSGYYMASAGGEDLIGWHVNRGWNQEADWFTASQFRAQYNRPDIVRLVLQTKDEAEAISKANEAAHRAAPAKPVAAALPPVVTITSPADGSFFSGATVDVTYSLRSPSGLPVDRLDVLADGQAIATTGFKATTTAEPRGHVVATMPRKDAKLTLVAYSGALTSAPVAVNLTYDGPKPLGLMSGGPKLKLYALLVGVKGYSEPGYDTIKFAAADATSIEAALKAQEGGLYAKVETRVVDDATRDKVLDGLYWLQDAAHEDDIAVIFLSGHGVLDPENRFWFLTREAKPKRLLTTAVSGDELLELIGHVKGKKVLLLDACHAGAVAPAPHTMGGAPETSPDMNTLANDFIHAGPGVVVYGASTGRDSALEPRTPAEEAEWNHHSAFAAALIEAIQAGKAAEIPYGPITTDDLGHYLAKRVKELTDGDQLPIMTRPEALPDFPIAVAKQ